MFGWRVCPVAGCLNTTVPKSGTVLCGACSERLRHRRSADPAVSVERFVATVTKQQHRAGAPVSRYTRATEPLCRVCCLPGARAAGGNQRPVRAVQLAASSSPPVDRGVRRRGRALRPGRPKPTFGECHVDGCDRWACTGNGLCRAHDPAWRNAGRRQGLELAEFMEVEAVRMRDPRGLKPRHLRVVSAKAVDLNAIDPTLRVELLLGLQRPRLAESSWSATAGGVEVS